MTWNLNALHELQAGQRAQVRPRGHSMSGRINNGDLVTLEPVALEHVRVGDVVLARVWGKRRELVVLHEVLENRGDEFLIGARNGRVDGWVCGAAIVGRASAIES